MRCCNGEVRSVLAVFLRLRGTSCLLSARDAVRIGTRDNGASASSGRFAIYHPSAVLLRIEFISRRHAGAFSTSWGPSQMAFGLGLPYLHS